MKRTSSRCGAGCAVKQSNSFGYSCRPGRAASAGLALPAGLAMAAAAFALPNTTLASDLGPTSTASAEISVTILPRVERLKVEASLEGDSMWMRSNFDGRIERYSKNLVAAGNVSPQGHAVEFDYGSQRVSARDGDILIFIPR